jgi:hypothetical protein
MEITIKWLRNLPEIAPKNINILLKRILVWKEISVSTAYVSPLSLDIILPILFKSKNFISAFMIFIIKSKNIFLDAIKLAYANINDLDLD